MQVNRKRQIKYEKSAIGKRHGALEIWYLLFKLKASFSLVVCGKALTADVLAKT